jgi:ADP-heptose:LPS heptosyltransferase
VILASSCLHFLHRLPLSIHVTWVGKRSTIALLAAAYPQPTYIAIEEFSSLGQIVAHLGDLQLLVDLQSNFRSWRLSLLFGLRLRRPRVALKKASLHRGLLVLRSRLWGRRWNKPEPLILKRDLQWRKMTHCLEQALKAHLPSSAQGEFNSEMFPPLLPLSTCALATLYPALQPARTILALAPGASFASKRAPRALLAAIIAELVRSMRNPAEVGLVLLGDAADAEVCRALAEKLHWEGPVLNVAGTLSLAECGQLLSHCAVLLSNDSSLSHLAEAVGTPTAVLFGPTLEAFGFAPQLANSRAFSVALGCRPCSKHGKTPCRYGDSRCFTAISPSVVAEYLLGFLKDS